MLSAAWHSKIGHAYYTREGVERDTKKAINHTYYTREGVERDTKKAIKVALS